MSLNPDPMYDLINEDDILKEMYYNAVSDKKTNFDEWMKNLRELKEFIRDLLKLPQVTNK